MTRADTVCPGELTLRVVADDTGRTRTAVMRQRYPQRMTAPLHCDPVYPHAAVVCVQSPSGGTFSDDTLHTGVQAERGSHLRITTQAATQVFAGSGTGARHRLRFRVDAMAALEYLPKTLIPHADSRYFQDLEVDVATTGSYLGWDAVSAGRLGHGERFRYCRYESSLRVSVEGKTMARDRQVIEPPTAPAARLIGADYLATLLIVAPGLDSALLLARLREAADDCPTTVYIGAGALPGDIGALVRIVTDHAPDLQRTQDRLLAASRYQLLQANHTHDGSDHR